MATGVVRRVWISKDAELILRDYWEEPLISGTGAARQAVTTNYTATETDVELPDDLFVFHPPPGSKLGEPVILGGIIGGPALNGRTLEKKVDPEYSDDARAAGLQGSVILIVEIEPDGHTENPQVIHTLGLGLDENAIDAVKQWRYDSLPNSAASRSRRVVEVPFRLKPAGPWVLDGSVFTANLSGAVASTTKPVLREYVAPDPALCSAQGYVAANFDIGSNGTPSGIQITNAPAENVRDGVLKTIQSWRFRPATGNGSDRPGNARVLLECRPAATPTVQGEIYRAPGPNPPALLFKTEPDYSAEARKGKLQGDMALSLIVEPDGKVSNIRILRPLGMGLNEQAIAAVMQWRFKPAMRDGKPVRVSAQITVNFRLL
jgi:TonB family protein